MINNTWELLLSIVKTFVLIVTISLRPRFCDCSTLRFRGIVDVGIYHLLIVIVLDWYSMKSLFEKVDLSPATLIANPHGSETDEKIHNGIVLATIVAHNIATSSAMVFFPCK
jgi:hypothetical protein